MQELDHKYLEFVCGAGSSNTNLVRPSTSIGGTNVYSNPDGSVTKVVCSDSTIGGNISLSVATKKLVDVNTGAVWSDQNCIMSTRYKDGTTEINDPQHHTTTIIDKNGRVINQLHTDASDSVDQGVDYAENGSGYGDDSPPSFSTGISNDSLGGMAMLGGWRDLDGPIEYETDPHMKYM